MKKELIVINKSQINICTLPILGLVLMSQKIINFNHEMSGTEVRLKFDV